MWMFRASLLINNWDPTPSNYMMQDVHFEFLMPELKQYFDPLTVRVVFGSLWSRLIWVVAEQADEGVRRVLVQYQLLVRSRSVPIGTSERCRCSEPRSRSQAVHLPTSDGVYATKRDSLQTGRVTNPASRWLPTPPWYGLAIDLLRDKRLHRRSSDRHSRNLARRSCCSFPLFFFQSPPSHRLIDNVRSECGSVLPA